MRTIEGQKEVGVAFTHRQPNQRGGQGFSRAPTAPHHLSTATITVTVDPPPRHSSGSATGSSRHYGRPGTDTSLRGSCPCHTCGPCNSIPTFPLLRRTVRSREKALDIEKPYVGGNPFEGQFALVLRAVGARTLQQRARLKKLRGKYVLNKAKS